MTKTSAKRRKNAMPFQTLIFRLASFRYFVFSHGVISSFRYLAWRFFRYFVFSLGVISSWRRAITPGENTKELTSDKLQSKTLFLAIFDPRSAIVNSVFNCNISEVILGPRCQKPFKPGLPPGTNQSSTRPFAARTMR